MIMHNKMVREQNAPCFSCCSCFTQNHCVNLVIVLNMIICSLFWMLFVFMSISVVARSWRFYCFFMRVFFTQEYIDQLDEGDMQTCLEDIQTQTTVASSFSGEEALGRLLTSNDTNSF